MMKDFKLGINILRYGMNVKASFIGAAIMCVLGVVCMFLTPSIPSNGLYTGMGGIMIVQTICSVSVSSMVQTSAMKKRLQTCVPVAVTACYMVAAHTLFLLLRWVACKWSPLNYLELSFAEMGNLIVWDALMLVILVLYNAAAMKLFWQSTIIFLFVYMGTYLTAVKKTSLNIVEAEVSLPLGTAIAASYAVIVLGSLLMYLMLKLMYKKPYSKMAFEALLKRAK